MAITKGIVAGGNYTFSAANQTVTFSSDYLGMSLSDITYITNITSGVATVIYDPFDPTKGGTLSGLVLTLAYNTVAMSDSDPLQIIVGFTPSTATPQNVNITHNTQLDSQTELLQNIVESVDLLAKSIDNAEGVQLNVRETTKRKQDVQNALIPSDAPAPIVWTFPTSSSDYIIDTTGYPQLVVYAIATSGSWNGSLTIQARNDTSSAFLTIPYAAQTFNSAASSTYGTQTTITTSGVTIFVNCSFRYIRIQLVSYTGGSAICTAYLRQTPLPIGPFSSLPVNANIASWTGGNVQAPSSSSATNVGQGVVHTGSIAVGSGFQPTTNPPNAATSLQTNVPWPYGIGGRELPYIGALGGIFRYITVDGGGRYILGGDTPDTETRTQSKRADGSISGIPPRGVGGRPNTMHGSQALLVEDVGQSEGDTIPTLLQQILVELKMLNQQINELPLTMNLGIKMQNEVGDYRQEEYNNHVNNQ